MTAITGHEEIDEMSASPGSAAAPFARRNVALGGLELEFYEGGEGRPLMFLHDGEWPAPQGPFLAALAARFHVIAPVHPGFGGTVMPAWMNSIDDFTHAHLALARHLLNFGVALEGAAEEYRPNFLCSYLHELAGHFARFYENCPVLKSEGTARHSRVALCDLTARVLKQGLDVLGIETTEQM